MLRHVATENRLMTQQRQQQRRSQERECTNLERAGSRCIRLPALAHNLTSSS